MLPEDSKPLFSNADLKRLIIPLVIEQMLTLTVGLADTMMITYAGEAAVSGVSLVDMINSFFLFVFSALATGGAVVVSQYLGSGDRERGCAAAGQLVMVTAAISLLLTGAGLAVHRPVLRGLFGSVEPDVMAACVTYFIISAISFPFMAVYSSCTALFRSMGKADVTMVVSIVMNVINVAGNAIGIFALQAGVMGVAAASLVSRIVAAVIMILLAADSRRPVFVRVREVFSWNRKIVRRILHIAVPNGIENGLFQLSKIALVGIIALFGTTQIAANGVANSIDYVGGIVVQTMGLAMVTVVGRCVGANDYTQARYYINKLLKISYTSSLVLDLALIALCPLILKLYALSDEARRLAFLLVVIHNFFIVTVYPLSGPLSSALRAAGDVKYTMVVSAVATVVFRILFSLVLGVWMGWGIIGIWIAMGLDWTIRAVLFALRYRSGHWKRFRVI